ncbi:ABC transporter permease [Paracoccus sp. p3-h83]|uniref:ABC transporter permease n=1 Tax=Paracoccus sp. p3-h83 TaxID=3342805 RepID=UPI0035BB666E
MPRLSVEAILALLILAIASALSLTAPGFASMQNLFDLLNASAVNMIFALGLLVVLLIGGIDISFSVGASVVQYVAITALMGIGGGNWAMGIVLAMAIGAGLGLFNAALIHGFRIVSIIVTIATFNLYFGLLMFLTGGRSIYMIPDWLDTRVQILSIDTASGAARLGLPVAVVVLVAALTWAILNRTGFGRQLAGYGSNPEAALRSGVSGWRVHLFAYGWLGAMAGLAGLMQAHIVREVVPNALYGREFDVLAATVLGGAVLGGGRGTVAGTILGVLLLAMVQNGLNLLGVSPYAFKIVVGAIILIAVTGINFGRLRHNLGGGQI